VADRLDPKRRSENMRRIRSKNTSPELRVRSELRSLGHTGYRLHRKELPGKPDIAFLGQRKAILIHGCFWHRHDCKEGQREAKSNLEYWGPKIARNQQRDAEHLAALDAAGWRVLVVWECELRQPEALRAKLVEFMAL
jgi:DNA mismatch endonuclease, patch repair protein